jgi:hypothetical protein
MLRVGMPLWNPFITKSFSNNNLLFCPFLP